MHMCIACRHGGVFSSRCQSQRVCAGEGGAAVGADAPAHAAGPGHAEAPGAPNQALEAGAQAGGLLRSVSAPEAHLRAGEPAAVRPNNEFPCVLNTSRGFVLVLELSPAFHVIAWCVHASYEPFCQIACMHGSSGDMGLTGKCNIHAYLGQHVICQLERTSSPSKQMVSPPWCNPGT